MYRTKIFNILNSEFLKPIMDFIGISRSDDPGCGLLKIVGADKRVKGKTVPTYFINQKNNKIFTIVESQDEFLNYRSRREQLEYFNPFIKTKNTLLMMLMTTPVVYSKVCSDSENDEDIINDICDEDMDNVSQEDVLSKVRVLQYPSEKQEDDRLLYTYKVEINDNDTINEIESKSCNQIIAMLMLIIKIMSYFDEAPIVLDKFNGSISDLQVYLEELLIKYDKERELNSKDIKKIKIETNVELYDSEEFDMFENTDNIDSLLSSAKNDEIEEHEEKKSGNNITVNLSDKYRDSIPYTYLNEEEDDDIMNLDLF